VEKYGTARQAKGHNITGCMFFEFWINMATDTHSEYVIFIATATLVARTLFSVTLYVHCLTCLDITHVVAKDCHLNSSVRSLN